MKEHIIIALTCLVLAGNVLAFNNVPSSPRGGVLDLSGSTILPSTLINLNGEWEFYWERLLTPESFPSSPAGALLVTVPSYWQSYRVNGQQLPGKGYGTYAMKLILPEGYRSTLCFDIPVFDVAYRLYINSLLVETNGRVGTSREEETPWYEPSTFCYIPDNDTLQLLIQVSNFHHRRGGFWKSMFTGGSEKILNRMEHMRIFSYSTIGILFFFIFFFFIFWLFTRKEIIMLYFALTALGMLIRSVNTGLYLSNMFIYTPWAWQIRMEYLGTYVAQIFGMIFLHKVFPARYMKWPIRINTALFSLAILSLFMFRVDQFSYEMWVFQPLLMLFLGHYLIVSLIGAIKGRPLDAIFFISMAFFIYTLVNDIMLANTAGAVSNNYLSQFSFQLFIFAMAVLIILQWVNNYRERTKLEASLRFKNKVLSVVAHDLKNPVASIAQFSDLLVAKPELAGTERFTLSLQESAQAAMNLLDNLLYWGRSQADELKISRVLFPADKLVREVESLYAHMATQKEIRLMVECPSNLEIFADKALINIVIRNLVSNALKFTPRHGSVRLKVTAEENGTLFSVTDTGVGMSEEIIASVKKFGQLDSSPGTDQEIGTGLGLQLASDLVRRHGGVLKIESTPGEGSVFSFTIPLHQS